VGTPLCLSCGHRQATATEPARVRYLSPMEWDSREGVLAASSG
jgi:hypothetical protein